MLITDYNYEIEESKDGFKIIKINREGKIIYAGSRYNVKRDIEKLISQIKGNKFENDILIIYGLGAGEHIRELRKIYNNKIIVFEPNKKVYNSIGKSQWISEDKNIQIICCEREELIKTVKENINDFNYKNSEYLFYANYDKVYHKEMMEFFNTINNYIVTLAMDVNTKRAFFYTWFENLIKSIKYIIKGIPADLYNEKFRNIPAVIVSAGPSLSDNIDMLKKAGNMLIISGGRTLGPLLEREIMPDILVVADSTQRNYTLVKDYLDKINVPLLFSESANLNILNEHKGIKLFYSYNDIIDKIAERKMTHISTGGSVAHAMASYAANIGCNPVIFIGQDFAYSYDKTHSEIAENKDGSYNYEIAKRDDDIYVEAIHGEKIRTSLVLDSQRRAMEQIISLYPNTTFINSSESGARIRGTKEIKFEEVLKQNSNVKKQKIEMIDYKVSMKKNAEEQLEKLKNKINSLIIDVKCCIDEIEKGHNYDLAKIIRKLIEYFKNDSVFEMILYNNVYLYKCSSEDAFYKEGYNFCRNSLKMLENSYKIVAEELEIIKKE